eukprot:TRINITY_DN8090_c0_g1_i1.p1 TRINITY_DN8090_c0_g1~~TRINITY_DN8090_c0_g1_i1.p1  ORF type:complete len:128 (+),score=23.14 TRINITY_DN8090_c0_g1_i1:168-551(+)
MVVHQQIKASLRGDQPPYSKLELLNMLVKIEKKLQRNMLLERKSTNYWILKFLEKHKTRVFNGLVTYIDVGSRMVSKYFVHVFLPELGYKYIMESNKMWKTGQRVGMKVVVVHPEANYLQMEPVRVK